MESKKNYQIPEVEVIKIEATNLLTASFSDQLQSTDPLDDPEDIL